jgi:hypothetical protein
VRRRALLLAAVLAGAVASAGCGLPQRQAAPLCELPAHGAETLVLLAQAVPTAQRVPCVADYPQGWHFADLEVRSGRGWFTLDNDRAGVSAVRVELTEACATEEFTEIASDEAETARFERVLSVEGAFRSIRAYTFDGGCVTYRFQFVQRGQALVNEVSSMLTFVSREDIDASVRASRGGGVTLDPPEGARTLDPSGRIGARP